jgi:hypothetical protein
MREKFLMVINREWDRGCLGRREMLPTESLGLLLEKSVMMRTRQVADLSLRRNSVVEGDRSHSHAVLAVPTRWVMIEGMSQYSIRPRPAQGLLSGRIGSSMHHRKHSDDRTRGRNLETNLACPLLLVWEGIRY